MTLALLDAELRNLGKLSGPKDLEREAKGLEGKSPWSPH